MAQVAYYPMRLGNQVQTGSENPGSIDEELRRISEAFESLGNLAPAVYHTAPEFPQPYQHVVADGTDWDPLAKGDGKSYIVYWNADDQVWKEVGSGTSVDLSDYYTQEEIDDLLADRVSSDDFSSTIGTISDAIDELSTGLQANVDDITSLQTDVDSVQTIVTEQSSDILALQTTYGDTASAAASAAAAATSEANAAAAEAAAIIAQAGSEAARDDAVVAQVAAESAREDAGTSATAAATSEASAASAATDAASAATAAETSRVEAVAAANAAVNAAQGGVTIDAAAGALWTFDSDLESWTSSNPSATWDSNGYLHQDSGTDPVLTSPAISVSGAGFKEVVARIRRNTGSGWEGRIRYSTSGHGFSGTYEVVLTDPLLVDGEWQVVSWNFSSVSDWGSSIITGIEVQLGSDSGGSDYDVDWIGVGNSLANLAQAAATSASNAASSATAAASSASAASSSATSASSSAAGAAGSASAAATSATSAATSASAAATSASAADSSKVAAQTAQSGAESAKTDAVTAKNDAQSASSAATSSATNAANSATAAAGSATAASGSASSASSSATTATLAATAAQASQVSAATFATNSSNSATAASTSAANASASASAASASATSAQGAATQAATSASSAQTAQLQSSNSSLQAANSASNASTSAQTASAAAATATTQASNASASASSASQSASLAAQAVGTLSAVNPLNVVGNASKWSTSIGSGSASIGTALINIGGRNTPVGVFTASGDTQFISDSFQIDPSGIYEVKISFCKDAADGQVYMGIYGDPTTNVQGVLNQANNGSATSNPYWGVVSPPQANTWYDYKFYLCGSAADVTKVPDATLALGSGFSYQNGAGLKTLDSANKVQIRILNWGNSQIRNLYVTNIFVTRLDTGTSAALKTEATVRASADSSMASSISSLSSTVGSHTSSITSLQQVLNGMSARYTLSLNANGQIAGMEIATGGGQQSSVTFLADHFAIALPGFPNVVPFAVGTVNGSPAVGIQGNLFVDGVITARHLSSNSLGRSLSEVRVNYTSGTTPDADLDIAIPAGDSPSGGRRVEVDFNMNWGATGSSGGANVIAGQTTTLTFINVSTGQTLDTVVCSAGAYLLTSVGTKEVRQTPCKTFRANVSNSAQTLRIQIRQTGSIGSWNAFSVQFGSYAAANAVVYNGALQ